MKLLKITSNYGSKGWKGSGFGLCLDLHYYVSKLNFKAKTYIRAYYDEIIIMKVIKINFFYLRALNLVTHWMKD